MRPKVTLLAGAAAVLSAGVVVAATVHLRDGGDEAIKQPALSFEQTPTAVELHIHNVNKHWGLRNQRLTILVRHPDGLPIISYGPDRETSVERRPELGEMRCCLIPELRPGGDFTFTLFPSRFTVGAFSVDLVGGPGWIRM